MTIPDHCDQCPSCSVQHDAIIDALADDLARLRSQQAELRAEVGRLKIQTDAYKRAEAEVEMFAGPNIHIESIEALVRQRKAINNLSLKDVRLFEGDKEIDISPEAIEEFGFCGLSTLDFFKYRMWEDVPTNDADLVTVPPADQADAESVTVPIMCVNCHHDEVGRCQRVNHAIVCQFFEAKS